MADDQDIHEVGVKEFGHAWYQAHRSAARVLNTHGLNTPAIQNAVAEIVYNALASGTGKARRVWPVPRRKGGRYG